MPEREHWWRKVKIQAKCTRTVTIPCLCEIFAQKFPIRHIGALARLSSVDLTVSCFSLPDGSPNRCLNDDVKSW